MYWPNLKSIYSFTRSWDNNDWSFGWGLQTPNLGEEEAVGGRGLYVPSERALVSSYSYRPSIVTFYRAMLRRARLCHAVMSVRL